MKKILNLSFLILLLGSLSSCIGTAKLSTQGAEVRYVTKAEAPKACKELGEVGFESFESSSSFPETKIMFKNKTAKMGGNFLVFDILKSPNVASGRAYHCELD